MTKYKDLGNEWITPIYRNFTIICCDCNLTHKVDFRIYKGKIQFRVKRNNYSTGNARRKK